MIMTVVDKEGVTEAQSLIYEPTPMQLPVRGATENHSHSLSPRHPITNGVLRLRDMLNVGYLYDTITNTRNVD